MTDDDHTPFHYFGYRRPRMVLNGREAETVGVTSYFSGASPSAVVISVG
jgi:hypothetical protein